MGTKRFNPVTPGTRFRIGSDFKELSKGVKGPEKSLVVPNPKSGGRNGSGKMTIRNVGGGHKRKYRLIDFKRNKLGVPGKVVSIEYDPNRTARIALINYVDGEKRYILAPVNLQVGQEIVAGDSVQPEVGNALPLKSIPLGTVVHNIESQPGRGGAIARSAGCSAQINSRDGKYVLLKMPSGEMRMILGTCMATVGYVSNESKANESLGKAGRRRWLGRRPRVRGVAMNPVDHPMGGGEGKSSGGHPRSRTGLLAKGLKTRKKNKHSNRLIIDRKKKK